MNKSIVEKLAKKPIFTLMLWCFLGLISNLSAQHLLQQCIPFSQGTTLNCPIDNSPPAVDVRLYRTINGKYNNLRNINAGAAGIPMVRKKGVYQFENNDGNTMIDRGNARTISNEICDQVTSIDNEYGLNAMVFTFLQFLDHDITLTERNKAESAAIQVPTGDRFFDPNNTGSATIPFSRSEALTGTGNSSKPRENLNFITAWVDASNIYGSDKERATWLRSFVHGKLKAHKSPNGAMLPCNTITGKFSDAIDPHAPEMDGARDNCGNPVKVFVSGDIRANEQPGLTLLHTIFMREHNAICEELVSKGFTDDEWNYQYARKIVGGIMQNITFNEVLPQLGIYLPKYRYQPRKRPDIHNEFATAAYRLGHTMINESMDMLDEACDDKDMLIGCGEGTEGVFGGARCAQDCGSSYIEGTLPLRDAFFNPSLIANNGIDAILNGILAQSQQKLDTRITGSLRNFLFGAPGSGGLDLAAINIQRGRDHGLADFNTTRRLYGMRKYSKFSQITSDRDLAASLKDIYGSINNIDLWVGLLAEDHLPGIPMGKTLRVMLKYQFQLIRNADRFYFERDPVLSWNSKKRIRNTKLMDIINRNTGVSARPAFVVQGCEAPSRYCQIDGDSRDEWIKFVKIGHFRNNSGNDGGYGDYTQSKITLRQNSYNPLVLSTGYGYRPYRQHWKIWIDFNKDGDFEDKGELVYYGRRRYRVRGYLHLPHNATKGETTMRVAMSFYKVQGPCDQIKYGEAEDYTVEIIAKSNDRLQNVPDQLFDINEVQETTSLKVSPNPTFDRATVSLYSRVDQKANLQIIHSSGASMYQEKLNLRQGDNAIEIDGSSYEAGVYSIYIDFEKTGRQSTKIVIVR